MIDLDRHRDMARQLLRAGQPEIAETLSREVIRAVPRAKGWLPLLAMARYHQLAFDEALDLMDYAIRQDGPDDTFNDLALGLMALSAGRTPRALAWLGRSLPAHLYRVFETAWAAMQQPDLPPVRPALPETIFGISLWGDAYLDHFLELALPSLLSPGNLPRFAATRTPTVLIRTTATGGDRIRRHPLASNLRAVADLQIREIPAALLGPDIPKYTSWSVLNMMTTHVAIERRADLFLVLPDLVLADGALLLVDAIADRFDALAMQGISAATGAARPRLARFRDAAGVITATPRALADIAFAHPAPAIDAFVPRFDPIEVPDHPGYLHFRKAGGIELRTFFPVPIWLSHRVLGDASVLHWSTPDNGLLSRLFPTPDSWPRIRFVQSTDEFGFLGVEDGADATRTGRVGAASIEAAAQHVAGQALAARLVQATRLHAFCHQPLQVVGSQAPAWPVAPAQAAFREHLLAALAAFADRQFAPYAGPHL